MAREIVLTDPVYMPKDRLSPLEDFLMRYVKEDRDLPIAKLLLAMAAVLWPTAAFLFTQDIGILHVVAYYALLFGLFFDRFILALHNYSHRQLFKPQYRWLSRVATWTIGPFAGETPETYFVHHIGMHHAEGNLLADLSSTMPYRRDSLRGFLHYWASFFFLVHPALIAYMARRKRWSLVKRMVAGELGWLTAVVVLGLINLKATLLIFVGPVIISRFLMMAGNWAQHAFVDPDEPDNDRKSSIVCINCRYNRRCFNDGYHIGHHEKPNLHWSEMPADFLAKRETYVRDDAVVFEGIDYFQVWGLLMLKRYDVLARNFVDLREEPRSQREIVALLRHRTQPIGA
ncbi:MAG: fatty acid desaturase [Myxococcota bacterium]